MFLPYGRQQIDDDDIKAVVDALKSDFITTGPKVADFEKAICEFTGAGNGVAVSSGTAALHCMMAAAGIGPGDEVIIPAMTFAASANSVLFQGGKPIFADVSEDTLLIDPASVEKLVGRNTKAILAVDYAGQPCDYPALRRIADARKLLLLSDACHSLGAKLNGRNVGTLADATAFSFHPVKHITTGEGGMAVCDDAAFAKRLRLFRNHGIGTDYKTREERGQWFYEMDELGFNYRISDFQCALGISQLAKLPAWLERRRAIASHYDTTLAALGGKVDSLKRKPEALHSHHLYVVKIKDGRRDKVFSHLRKSGIGANVHYIPVHLHPYYVRRFGSQEGGCPVAEKVYKEILSLPVFPKLRDEDIDYVVAKLAEGLAL